MLKGFTAPFTPSGVSSLVSPPPWHYAGQVLSLGFDVDPQVAQRFLPDEFGPATGRAYGHFCEWQATTDGSELLDPVYAQYKEFFIAVEAESVSDSQGLALFCPLIWVDQDISMVRGLLQGWPKKLGQLWMTRSYDLDHPAAARAGKGARLGASLAVKDRRLADIDVTLDGRGGERLGLLQMPLYCLSGSPSIIDGEQPAPRRLLRASVEQTVLGPLSAGTASVRFYESPRDEIAAFTPLGDVEVSVGQVAITVTGAVEAPRRNPESTSDPQRPAEAATASARS